MLQAESSSPGGDVFTNFFPAMSFISALSGLMDFSEIVILCSRPNSCCQQNLSVLIGLYLLYLFL